MSRLNPMYRLRLKRRISPQELAELMGVDVSTILRTELGLSFPHWITIKAFAEVFEVDPVWLKNKLRAWHASRSKYQQEHLTIDASSQIRQLPLPLVYNDQPYHAS